MDLINEQTFNYPWQMTQNGHNNVVIEINIVMTLFWRGFDIVMT